jgi:hypothetical protein
MDELVRGERMETKALDELIEYTKSFDDYATSGLGDKASAELASLKARLAEADENLLSMVNHNIVRKQCARMERPKPTRMILCPPVRQLSSTWSRKGWRNGARMV